MSEIKNIALKLLQVQKEIGVVEKDKENPYFKSKYADINSLLSVIKPVLSKNGLILLQPIQKDEQGNIMTTEIIDSETGETIISQMILPVNPDPQKYGAILTYFRRYALTSLLSIEAEDTDGNDFGNKQTEVKAVKTYSGTNLATIKQKTFIKDLCKKQGAKDLEEVSQIVIALDEHFTALDKLTFEQASNIISKLKNRNSEKAEPNYDKEIENIPF